MPLDTQVIKTVLDYCKRDLPDNDWFVFEFDFIEDADLRSRLAQEFYAARYIYKLMSALSLSGDELFAHLKLQIIQYASIYEAVVVYLLTKVYKDTEVVLNLFKHKTYKPVQALSSSTEVYFEGLKVYPCIYEDTRTPISSVKFDDKVDALVDLGVFDQDLADDIKVCYKLRNSIHIQTAVRNNISYEIEQSKVAYRRMRPFIDRIKDALTSLGKYPIPQVEQPPTIVPTTSE